MKELIVLSKRYGRVVSFVDDEDFDMVSKYNWNISESKGNLYLTARQVIDTDKKRKVKIHQLLMWPYDSKNFVVDHKNRNALDNRKENLRIVTTADNCKNRRPQSNKSVPYKGVHNAYKSFRAEIMVNGVRIGYGGFKTPEEAALKYNELARIHHGEFAYQNIIP